MLIKLCTHPNVGAVLLVGLGCESMNSKKLLKEIEESKRPSNRLIIQETGGTTSTISKGKEWVNEAIKEIASISKVDISWNEITIGTICGGSDATSGITANPAVGRAFDVYNERGATTIFEETGEMIGCFNSIIDRGTTDDVKTDLANSLKKAAVYYEKMGHGSFAPGNADGGLTTIEEKSLGAYTKGGSKPIKGVY